MGSCYKHQHSLIFPISDIRRFRCCEEKTWNVHWKHGFPWSSPSGIFLTWFPSFFATVNLEYVLLHRFIQVYEILDNCVDEAQAGFASKVDIVLLADGSVRITDNGRGVYTSNFSNSNYSILIYELKLKFK